MQTTSARSFPGRAAVLAVGISAAWLLALLAGGGRYLLSGVAGDLPRLLLALGITAALYLLPGLALLAWLRPFDRLALAERVILALLAGTALPPLLLELARLLGVRWGPGWVMAYLVLVAGGLALAAWRGRRRTGWTAARGLAESGLLLGLLALVFAGALLRVRGLPAGMLGDAYQHTLMAQLLVDNGGLFSSWAPYAPLTTFSYHFGFHAQAAFWHWLTGWPLTQSVLVVGQVLAFLAAGGMFVLAARLTGSRWAGLLAALLVAFINLQPAYFVNWGRYTQLAGQVVLVGAALAWAEALEQPQPRLAARPAALAAVLTAGLALTHYIVAVFLALFVLGWALIVFTRRPAWRTVVRLGLVGGLTGLAAGLLAAPWLRSAVSGFLVRNTGAFVQGAVGAERAAQYAALEPITPFYIHPLVLALAGVGLLRALARRTWGGLALAAWFAGLMALAAPHVLGLPGTGAIDFFAVYLGLYLPLGALAGFGLAWPLEALRDRARPVFGQAAAVLLAVVVIAGSVWGVRQQRGLRDDARLLLTPADAAALEWLRTNTPPDARVLVTSFPAYGGSLVAGVDGGWWIPLLAGRQTNQPPLTYGSEHGPAPDYAEQVNAFWEALRGQPLTEEQAVRIDLSRPEILERVRAGGYRYIYLGANAYPPAGQADWIDPQPLLDQPGTFPLLYEQGGVRIFGIQ